MSTPPREGWTARHDEIARENGRESWVAWLQESEQRLGYSICGRRKKSGRPCEHREAAGCAGKTKGACKWHGGASLSGVAAPGFRHGLSTVSMTTRSLRDRMQANGDADPRKMMQAATSFLMARFDELVDQMDAGEAGPVAMDRARAALAALKAAATQEETTEAVAELEAALKGGAAAAATLDEFYRLVGMMGQHAERYRRVMEAAGEYVERIRAVALMDRFACDVSDIIETRPYLSDDHKHDLRRAIVETLLSYTNQKAVPSAHAIAPPAEEVDDVG